MKTSFKRAAAWLLTVLMILSCVPALATESVTEVGVGFSLDIPTTYASTTTYNLYCYTLLPGKSTSSTGTPDSIWNGMGVGSIEVSSTETGWALDWSNAGSIIEGHSVIMSYVDSSIISYPAPSSEGLVFPKLKIDGLDYTYAAPGSEYENTKQYYTIEWIDVTVSDGANAGANGYNPVIKDENNGGSLTYHLNGQVILNETNYVTVSWKIKEPNSDTFDLQEAYSKRVAINTNENTLTPAAHDDSKTVENITYIFDGWYYDEACTEKCNFTGTVVGNTTYYGRYVPKTPTVNVEKVWSGTASHQDSLAVTVKAGGTTAGTITLNSTNEWKDSANIERIRDSYGHVLPFTVEENLDSGSYYEWDSTQSTSSADQSSFTFTITNKQTKVDKTVTKIWDDDSNALNKRPANITVKLLADGTQRGDSVQLNSSNAVTENTDQWTYTWSALSKFDDDGVEITYTVDEDSVQYYKSSVSADGMTITNTIDVTTVTAEKIWNDASDTGHRPGSIKLTLKASVDGAVYTLSDVTTEKVVSAGTDGKWMATWENLPKTDADGKTITYTVEESAVEPDDWTDYYTLVTTTDSTTGNIVITNTLSAADVTITKYVAGNMGDQSKAFTFKIKATKDNSAVPLSDDSAEVDDDGFYTIDLWHDSHDVFTAVPIGSVISIKEVDAAGYDQTVTVGNNTLTPNNGVYSITIDADTEIVFTNTKQVVPDTGVVLDSLPYIVILAIVLVGVVLMVRKRRREDD